MKKKLFASSVILGMLAIEGSAFAGRDAAQASIDASMNPGPRFNSIYDYSNSGTGCDVDGVTTSLKMFNQFGQIPRNLEINFVPSAFNFRKGSQAKECKISFSANIPFGWRLVIDKAKLNVIANLASESKVKVSTTIKADSKIITLNSELKGAIDVNTHATTQHEQIGVAAKTNCDSSNFEITTKITPTFTNDTRNSLQIQTLTIPLKWEAC